MRSFEEILSDLNFLPIPRMPIWVVGCSALASLMVWRLWRFTIIPILHPTRPRELPYWMPFIGHSIALFFDSYGVLEQGRKYLRDSKEPYSITLAGQTIYVITSPEDVQSLYKNTTTISWLRFVQDLYRWIGISQPNIVKLWRVPLNESTDTDPARKLAPNEMIEEHQHRQLLPGENMNKISKLFVGQITDRLRWENIRGGSSYIRERHGDSVTFSLMDWTSDVFIRTTTEAYWGKSIWSVAPNLIEHYLNWEATTWKYVFHLPHFLSRDVYTARDQLVGAFTRYFGQPDHVRSDTAYFVPTAEAELRDIAFDDGDIAKVHMLQHWGINANMHKVTFWLFAYLCHQPQLLHSIREETNPGIVNDTPNVAYLLENCPQLEAIFLEILRLVMASSLMRHVTEPTKIGDKILEKGNNVMVPYRQLHFSQDVWGNDAAQFNPKRFLTRKELSRSPSYKPFGGGQHLCPGRFVARHAVFAFVALTLSRYDIRLDQQGPGNRKRYKNRGFRQRFPRLDESKPGLGALSPIKGDEVLLRLTPRTA